MISPSGPCELSRRVAVCILFSVLHFAGLFWDALGGGDGDGDGSSPAPGAAILDTPVKVYAPSDTSTTTVAICVVVKNETLYLDEWVDYHIALGFSPIYIYDNSLDFELMFGEHDGLFSWYDTRQDIREHIRLIHFPKDYVQVRAYRQCIKEDARNATFVALFDVDEFLVLNTMDNVADFMDYYCDEKCGQLSIGWRLIGTSNETSYRPGPLLKRNTHAGPKDHDVIKVIVRPTAVAYEMPSFWRHSVELNDGFHWVDTNGKVIKGAKDWKRQVNPGGPHDVALLYHYAYRSKEEFWYKKCVRGHSRKRGADQTPQCTNPLYYPLMVGSVFDNAAWLQLTRMVPKYRAQDVSKW